MWNKETSKQQCGFRAEMISLRGEVIDVDLGRTVFTLCKRTVSKVATLNRDLNNRKKPAIQKEGCGEEQEASVPGFRKPAAWEVTPALNLLQTSWSAHAHENPVGTLVHTHNL